MTTTTTPSGTGTTTITTPGTTTGMAMSTAHAGAGCCTRWPSCSGSGTPTTPPTPSTRRWRAPTRAAAPPLISLGGLLLTAAIQAGFVALSGSVALLGDTLHNLADALTAVP